MSILVNFIYLVIILILIFAIGLIIFNIRGHLILQSEYKINLSKKSKNGILKLHNSLVTCNIPIVSAFINNKEYSFIIDTGSDLNLILPNTLNELVKTNNLEIKKDNISINNIGSFSDTSNYTNINLKIQKNNYNVRFYSNNSLDEVLKIVENRYNKPIHGLLGSQFLINNKWSIDFSELIIITNGKED